ncbi:zinc-binding dehydrogenase [Streptomyces lydicus]
MFPRVTVAPDVLFIDDGGAHIDATFPLAEAAEAHARAETGRTAGKIVLMVG